MQTTNRPADRLARFVLAAGLCASVGACGRGPQTRTAQDATDKPFTLTLNRTDNGAATAPQRSADEAAAMPRTLSFEMAGFARAPDSREPQEERSAAAQAAIIDALGKALIEARRSRGQPDSDFTAQLGPRLTVHHCRVNGGYQVEVTLVARGVETSFVVRDGVLQHPPRDLKLIQRIFYETNGEFSLLGTEWLPESKMYVAKVGCYLPAGLGEALAGEAAEQLADDPPAP